MDASRLGHKKTQGVMEMIYEYLDADTGQTVHLVMLQTLNLGMLQTLNFSKNKIKSNSGEEK